MINIVDEEIKRTNKNLLIFNGILLLVIVIFLVSSQNYWYNFIKGPFPKSKFQIINIHNISELKEYYVELEGDDFFDTGISDIERKIDRNSNKTLSEITLGYYGLLKLDDNYLIVFVNRLGDNKKIRGILKEVPKSLGVKFLENKSSYGDIRILPFMLEEIKKPDVLFGLLLLAIPLLISIFNISNSIIRNNFKSRHPITQDLQHYFDYDNPISELIEDFNNHIVDKKDDSYIITKKWILLQRIFKSQFIRLDDILWVYKKVTTRSINFIPLGQYTKVVLFNRSGKMIYYKDGNYCIGSAETGIQC